MAWIKYICIFSIAVLFTCTKGNVIRLDSLMNGHRLTLHDEGEGGRVIKDSYLKEDIEDGNFIQKDERTSLEDWKETDSNGIRSLQHHSQLISLRHFARHGLCRSIRGKQRFYTALKSKFCHTKGTFIFQLVEDLCAEIANCKNTEKESQESGKNNVFGCGKSLFHWVSELFDLNGDEHVDHFERHFYDYRMDN